MMAEFFFVIIYFLCIFIMFLHFLALCELYLFFSTYVVNFGPLGVGYRATKFLILVG
jgi:hypothetical protein